MSVTTQTLAEPPVLPIQRTRLHPFHLRHGGHMVPFAGWEMPLYYRGILAEHAAVRTNVGLFDVSHMGIVTVDGTSAAGLLARRTTANIAALAPGQCRYAFWLSEDGKIVDDLLVTRVDDGAVPERRHIVVPNASRSTRFVELLRQHRRPDTTVTYRNGAVAILAVQGPGSRALLEAAFGWSLGSLDFYTARWFPRKSDKTPPSTGVLGPAIPAELERAVWVSRTGYTGELGYELFVAGDNAVDLAENLVGAGAVPCGLGARDTLRLEKGYLLSGQDFLADRTPLEAGQDRFVDFDHPFVGREALEKQQKDGLPQKLVGLTVLEEGVLPRHGTPLVRDGQPVGVVTSGGLSPSLHHGIALAYLAPALATPGTLVELEVRGRRVPAEVVKLPFLARAPVRR
ncbi:MAG: glycine cleavage system aminomethyltransferase GcvT [Thermoplasmata archaeon]|nr:glycine cleavage system aminomethyltransferase GcvT [Thermoplasmata archaeon]